MNIIGIDLGKMVFHIVTMDPQGKILGRKKLSRPQLLTHLVNAPPSLVIRIDALPWIFFGNERGQPSEIRIKVDCRTVACRCEIEDVPEDVPEHVLCVGSGVTPA